MIENILNSLEAGIILIDTDHRIKWMNNKVTEWFGPMQVGVRRACYRTRKYTEMFCMTCPTGRTIDFGIPVNYEFIFSDNGKSRTFNISGIPIRDKEGKVFMVMELLVDVSNKDMEKKNKEDLMAQIEKMAAIGQLAAGVAHELNTPLGTISIISQELKSILKGSSVDEKGKYELEGYLNDMSGEIKRCMNIIGDLLSFSRGGISELFISDVDINELLSQTIDFICNKGGAKGIAISKNLSPLPKIKTDLEKFRQVIFNVFKNAVEAVADTKGGKIDISTSVYDKYIKVLINDNGCGITKENLKKIFDPFFTTKPVGKGTGIGLFVCYSIIRSLKGDIKVESTIGMGTAVSLLLPVEGS
ncbi:MAG: GHKL domain-containing protein [Nitrospinae bacterium]|nr:GHKL domain-containing protein [Nitrospinota bacterium]MBI3813742.1 GHKL domain-containing protein [Nitrospinota bacterium]